MNGFTHGFADKPHGYKIGAPAAPAALPRKGSKPKDGFGHNSGTIPGLQKPAYAQPPAWVNRKRS